MPRYDGLEAKQEACVYRLFLVISVVVLLNVTIGGYVLYQHRAEVLQQ